MRLFKYLVPPIFLIAAGQVAACTWYGYPSQYKSFGVSVHFVGKLIERNEVLDENEQRVEFWAKFEPLFPIVGQWGITQKVFFPSYVQSLDLLSDHYYSIYIDQHGRFVDVCGYHSKPQEFNSLESASFRFYRDETLKRFEEEKSSK